MHLRYRSIHDDVLMEHRSRCTPEQCRIHTASIEEMFSHEGVPTVLVTDNGTHFTAKFLEEWLKGLGCRHLFTLHDIPSRMAC
ncbi:hypothetical protein CLF_107897 [Clonorchis sinensis]|uniref:Integrase catalytic domain-containing protein n=1 Tax=Clonorchis sinensis TaxID=79923 RepID=G7YR48_CLOSI|nr:hypothetical protein CLF_107897 [Clonorchis sinensis]